MVSFSSKALGDQTKNSKHEGLSGLQSIVLLGLISCLCSGAATAEVPYPWGIGHRGGNHLHPENTLVDFEFSLQSGAQGLEIDVWLSADGVPVVHHDPTVDRTTDGTGLVYEKTLAELKALDAGSYRGPEFAGERIPTFDEALAVIQGHKLFLDIKAIPYVPDIVQALHDFGFPPEDVWVWNRFGTGPPFQALMPEANFVGSLSSSSDHETQMLEFVDRGWSALNYNFQSADRDFIELAHSYGLLVMTSTVQSPYFQEQIDRGVDILVASVPTLLAPLISGTLNACEDGLDGDGDGLIDHPDDPGCFGPADRNEEAPCSDGIDNDGDGSVDFPADPGCFAAYSSTENPQCSDGIDNNDDADIDYPNDAGCVAAFDQHEQSTCADGLDNDGDGLFDHQEDPDCPEHWSNGEISECNDGIDNDADGFIDFPDDLSCADLTDTREAGPPASEDVDGDLIRDVEDNCTLVPNTDQADFDQDSAGDLCDSDDDEDGVFDIEDSCQFSSNPAQTDTDQDGYGNLCDSDFDGSGFVDGIDFFFHFLPAFASGEDTGVGTDMNGDGIVDGIDFATGFIPQFIRGRPGPSGRDCAGAPPCS